jgi:hypothetical protein
MNKKWIERIERQYSNLEKPSAYKEKTLKTFEIKDANQALADKIGKFKIKKQIYENIIGSKLIEKDLYEALFYFEDNKWVETLHHSYYVYTFDVDHGRESEREDDKLIPIIYFDEEKNTYYIETEEGGLYCSVDGKRWFLQLLEFEKRPYYGRINKLRKIAIS